MWLYYIVPMANDNAVVLAGPAGDVTSVRLPQDTRDRIVAVAGRRHVGQFIREAVEAHLARTATSS
jgi:hypothetical protein